MGDAKFSARTLRLYGNTPTGRKYKLICTIGRNHSETQTYHRFDRLADAPVDENGVVQKQYDIIQSDGLAGVGERVDPRDIYVNKQSPVNASDKSFTGQAASVPYKNAPLSYKSPVAGHIDKVMITDTENEHTLIKVLIRQTRRPELGDKFSSRHGQKGVCGLIVNQEDMPFNDQGINPGKHSTSLEEGGGREAELTRRHDHEPSRVPFANDGGEDDRTFGRQGVLRLPFLGSLPDLNRNSVIFFSFYPDRPAY